MLSKRFYGAAMMAAVVIPVTLEGCSSDSPLCCTEFKAGATIDANIGGNAQAQVAVQAVGDFAGIASAAIDDLTTACRSIAQDLDADKTAQDAAEAKGSKNDRMNAWCDLAVAQIAAVKAKAQGTLKLTTKAPSCSASVSAKANCQAKCSVDGKCDIKAHPPTCTGGKLEVACKGECSASANATLTCEGSCDLDCKGSCTAQGGVRCQGKCEGTCTAQGSANGQAFDAQGNCQGTCQGTCSATQPGVHCEGSCQGECTGKCKAEAGATVKCDGTCDADYEPLKCEGGKLEGGCQVDAQCNANCDASVQAKAECTPPEITVELSGSADIQAAAKLRATIEANFGVILAFKSRLAGMADLTVKIAANADAVASIKAACIPQVLAAAKDAGVDVAAAVSVTGKLATSVGTS